MRAAYNPNLKNMPLSSVFYALSDPVRLKIIRLLLDNEELACGECKTSVSKSTMSHHFKVLRDTGLIQKRDDGTKQLNSIRRKEIEKRFPGLLDVIQNTSGPL